MGIGNRGTNAIRIKSTSRKVAQDRGQQLLADNLPLLGLDAGGLTSANLRALLMSAQPDASNTNLLEYLQRCNSEELKQFFNSIRRYDSSFIKGIGNQLQLSKDLNGKDVLSILASRIGETKDISGASDFFIPLLSNYLAKNSCDEKDLDSLPSPFNYYWLNSAGSDDRDRIFTALNELMQKDLAGNGSYNTKIAYGFLLQNRNIESDIQRTILEGALDGYREIRKETKTATQFADVLSYAFEYAPLNDDFQTILEDTFPVLLDVENSRNYMRNDYTYEDLAIVSSIFYNQNVDLPKREATLLSIVDNYTELADRISQVPLNQFFESLNFGKISNQEEQTVYARLTGEQNSFAREAMLKSFARNEHLTGETLRKIFQDNDKNNALLENLAHNTTAPLDLLQNIAKKGNARVKRVVEETIGKIA